MAFRGKKLIRDLLRALLSSINDHWVIRSVIGVIPGIVAFAVAFTPVQNWFVVPATKQSPAYINAWGIVLIIVVICLIVVEWFSNAVSSHDSRDMLSYVGENQLRRKIAETETTYETDRNELLRNSYKTIAYNENKLDEYIRHYINPKSRTRTILTQISRCLAEEGTVSSDEITLSAAVSCNGEKWEWLCPPPSHGMGDLKELATGKSAFYQVITTTTYFYANDKQEAIDEEKYKPDKRDESTKVDGKIIGSIICWEVATQIPWEKTSDEKEINNFRMIVSISTYGKKMFDDTKHKKQDIGRAYTENIQNIILERFRGELTENLIWYGLTKLKR